MVLIVLRGGCESPVATFFLGALLTSAVEYITSYAMEKLFHMRWWDYSRYRFQLNGRICLLNSSLFGLASVVLCHGIGPAVSEGVLRLFAAGAALPLAAVLAVLYVSDIVVSVRSAIQIGQRLEKLHAVHDELAAKLDALKEESRQAMLDQREKLGTSLTSARQTASEKAGRAAQGPSTPGWSPWASWGTPSTGGWTRQRPRPNRSSSVSTTGRASLSAVCCAPTPPSAPPNTGTR